MGKFDLASHVTEYERRDPVTGKKMGLTRTRRAAQSSPALKAFQACVAKGMRGFKASGATPQQRAANLRARFAQVAASCK